MKIIQQLHRLDVKTRESALRELMQHDNGLYRYEALRKYCSSFAATIDIELVFSLLEDASRKVRDTAELMGERLVELRPSDPGVQALMAQLLAMGR